MTIGKRRPYDKRSQSSQFMSPPRRIFLVLALALLWAGTLALAHPIEHASDTSEIEGKILGIDGKPVPGARLLSYHLSSERLFTSEPTGTNGECLLEPLPFGYHDLAVETADGLFVGSQVVNIGPNAKVLVVLTLYPAAGEPTGRGYAGSEREPIGQAQVVERPRGRAFWRSPRGVAVLAGSGAVALLLLAGGGGDDENNASPF